MSIRGTTCIDFGRCCILDVGRGPRNERLHPFDVGLVAFVDLERVVFILVPAGSCCPRIICVRLAVLVAELGPDVGLFVDEEPERAVAILMNGREKRDVEPILSCRDLPFGLLAETDSG